MQRIVKPAVLNTTRERLLEAPWGERNAVLEEEARFLGMSPGGLRAKIRRELCSDELFDRIRQRRSDAGSSVISPTDLETVGRYLAGGARKNGMMGGDLDGALLLARPHISPEAAAMSLSTWRLRLRLAGFSQAQLAQDEARRIVTSDHPNHVHIIDATVSWRFYWRPKGGLGTRDVKLLDPQNKPDNAALIAGDKAKLILYILVDHCSGAIFGRYGVSRGENSAGIMDLLFEAWRDKQDPRFPFRGACKKLYSDKGAANFEKGVESTCAELGIPHVPHATGNAPAGGSAERAIGLIQDKFEYLFRFMKDPESVDELNRSFYGWLVWFNATKKHSRHGHTRMSHWANFIREEHLRLIPENRKDFFQLAYAYTTRAQLRSNRTFRALGGDRLWMLPDGCNWATGTKLLVQPMALEPEKLKVKRPDTLEEVVATLIKMNVHGFPVEAAHGSHGKGGINAITPTPASELRETTSIKGLLETYGHYEGLPDLVAAIDPIAFPRREGTQILSDVENYSRPISLFEAKLRLADFLGQPLSEEEAASLDAEAENGTIDERLVNVVIERLSADEPGGGAVARVLSA